MERNWFAAPVGLVLVGVLTIIGPQASQALRTGAPSMACISLRPFHGLNRAKPASASQFFVMQSSLAYAPGQNITVEIATHSNERYFRGFIVQAYDPTSGTQIGNFISSEIVRPLDGCSGATHRNNLNKQSVELIWVPPLHQPAQSGSSGHSDSGQSATSQWLGLPAPHLSVTSSQQKRMYFFSVDPKSAESQSGLHEIGGQPASGKLEAPVPSAARSATNYPMRQVRFRASVVVTYEEFYTGFESSDAQFGKFGFANNTSPSPIV